MQLQPSALVHTVIGNLLTPNGRAATPGDMQQAVDHLEAALVLDPSVHAGTVDVAQRLSFQRHIMVCNEEAVVEAERQAGSTTLIAASSRMGEHACAAYRQWARLQPRHGEVRSRRPGRAGTLALSTSAAESAQHSAPPTRPARFFTLTAALVCCGRAQGFRSRPSGHWPPSASWWLCQPLLHMRCHSSPDMELRSLTVCCRRTSAKPLLPSWLSLAAVSERLSTEDFGQTSSAIQMTPHCDGIARRVQDTGSLARLRGFSLNTSVAFWSLR